MDRFGGRVHREHDRAQPQGTACQTKVRALDALKLLCFSNVYYVVRSTPLYASEAYNGCPWTTQVSEARPVTSLSAQSLPNLRQGRLKGSLSLSLSLRRCLRMARFDVLKTFWGWENPVFTLTPLPASTPLPARAPDSRGTHHAPPRAFSKTR